jgi:deazaflavin-dependent oxidoreductase (nitroreductase family)
MSEQQVDMNEVNRQVIEEFRANAGKVLTGRFAGSNLVLLSTTGAKSGAARVKPLMYVRSLDKLIVFASRNGGPRHPAWYFNLVARPQVTVEIGDEKFEGSAVVTSGEERQRIWEDCVRQHPFLADIQARAQPRQIPVISLEREESQTG